jgi:hypothetical protein
MGIKFPGLITQKHIMIPEYVIVWSLRFINTSLLPLSIGFEKSLLASGASKKPSAHN